MFKQIFGSRYLIYSITLLSYQERVIKNIQVYFYIKLFGQVELIDTFTFSLIYPDLIF